MKRKDNKNPKRSYIRWESYDIPITVEVRHYNDESELSPFQLDSIHRMRLILARLARVATERVLKENPNAALQPID